MGKGGWVKLKEKGYIPTTKQGYCIKSEAVSCKAGRYYVSVLIDIPDTEKPQLNNFGLGIDKLKEMAITLAYTVPVKHNKQFPFICSHPFTNSPVKFDFIRIWRCIL